MPEFLGDVRRERLEEEQELANHQILDREAVGLALRVLQLGLRDLDVPVAEVAPEEAVELLRGGGEFEAGERLLEDTHRVGERREDGVVVLVEERGLEAGRDGVERAVVAHLAAHLAEARGVPELVAEVAAALDAFLVELHVLAERRDLEQAEAQAVGAVLRDELERIGRVAERLRHLATLFVADDAVEIDVLERNALLDRRARAGELEAGHDHARDPEEDDVGAGGQRGGRIERVEAALLLRVGVGPAKRADRPEPRGGPGVEHVLLLVPVLQVGRAVEGNVDLRRVLEVGLGELLLVNALPIPDRDAVAPPELAADAPILDAVEPVEVNLRPALRVELDQAVAHDLLGLLDARVAQPPLLGEARLDRHVGALGEADVVLVGLLLDE